MKNAPLFFPFNQVLVNSPTRTSTLTNQPVPSISSKLPQKTKIIGNYLLGKNIGQGTFGKVHLAMHIPTNQKVAVKIIDKAKMRPKDVNRVKCEIQILKSVHHRHIVQLYEIIETQKSLLLFTEYMQNGELFRQIIKQKKIQEDQACRYFQQIISAVSYLHDNQIAHRDLKPENILIDYDKQLKIIDFGLSTFYEKDEELKTFCGSPCYAAPEIIDAKKKYNPLMADVWSLGVILFAMLCGYLPFCDADTHTLFKKIMTCNYKIPSHVSPQAKSLIQSLLVLTPNKRLALSEIKSHEWCKRLSTSPSYGLKPSQNVNYDADIIKKVSSLNLSQQKVICDLARKEKNRDTAAYFILMKKLVRSGQKIPSYIGSDYFNPKLIRAEEKIDENDTEYGQSPYIPTPHAPEMPKIDDEPAPGEEVDWWDLGQKQAEILQIGKAQLINITTNILDLLVDSKLRTKRIENINEIVTGIDNPQNLLRVVCEKREDQFYCYNMSNRKAVINLVDIMRKGAFNKFILNAEQSRKKLRSNDIKRVNNFQFREINAKRKNQQSDSKCNPNPYFRLGLSRRKMPIRLKTSNMANYRLNIKIDVTLPKLPPKKKQTGPCKDNQTRHKDHLNKFRMRINEFK